MVHRAYTGLGPPQAALKTFEALAPYAAELFALQAGCAWGTPDRDAMGVAPAALETTAFHFTRRRHFYDAERNAARAAPPGNSPLSDRAHALKAFLGLAPYMARLRGLQTQCRPFGRDYLALQVAQHGLVTAAYHFTGRDDLYGLHSDGSGRPLRPPL